MNFATLDEVRTHLNMEVSDMDGDMINRLTQYMNSALEYISIKLNAELVESPNDIPGEDDPDYKPNKVYLVFSYTMKQCELMIVEEFFKHRGTSSATLSRPTAITVDMMLNKQRFFNV